MKKAYQASAPVLPRLRKVAVIVRMDHATGRARLEGILRFLRHASDWQVKLIEQQATPATIADTLADGVDGFIVFQHLDADTWRRLVAARVPIVSIESVIDPDMPHGRDLRLIRVDDEGIGELAAQHLLSVGNFRTFVFVPSPGGERWSTRRQAGFAAALKAAGRTCAVFPSPDALNTEKDAPLVTWLADLPRPFALYAATDLLATRVLSACRAAKIDVPRQAAVLGTDDDVTLCTHTAPPISSIRFVTERQGELVARELEKMMNGRCTNAATLLPWTHREIVRRESTAPITPAARLIDRARDLIDRYATKGWRVGDVARELGVSRQLLNLRFRQFERESVAEALDVRRFAELVRRLEESRAPIARVARACGFRDLSNLTRRFRARFGKTMRDYRAECAVQIVPCRRDCPSK